MNRTGAIVVTHNSEGVIGRCLDSCLRAGVDPIVVDNASSDGTCGLVAERPFARLIVNRVNRGFAAAVNQGLRDGSHRYILLLNPDVELGSSVTDLERACEDRGAAAGLLLGRTGEPQRGFAVRRLPAPPALVFEVLGINRVWPSNPVNRRYRCLDLPLDAPADVEQPAGAFWMIRRDVWERIGGMDESFHPLWFEDVDLANRLAACGRRTRLVPSVTAIHEGAHSVQGLAAGTRYLYWYTNLLRYSTKHYPPLSRRAVALAAMLGVIGRMVTGIVGMPGTVPVKVHCKVIRLALQVAWSGRIGEETQNPPVVDEDTGLKASEYSHWTN